MTVNGLLDIPVNQLYNLIYIYKITCKHTGHYYVGQTNSVKDRMYQHLSTIIKIMEQSDCKRLFFHDFIACKLKNIYEKDKRFKLEKFVRESLSVYIIALVADKDIANIVESHYIAQSVVEGLCLNSKL